MNEAHLKNLENEMRGIDIPRLALEEKLKRIYYVFERPIMNVLLRRKLSKKLKSDPAFSAVDRFLFNEGGMFKRYAYGISARIRSLKGAMVLVPGVGYGRHLYQLASFQPKQIVAFDPYARHEEEWDFLKKRIKEKHDVEIEFISGGFDRLPRAYVHSFDHIISDAVIAHVADLRDFLRHSRTYLKEGGVFYASYGPIWYGPRGDLIDWGEENLFDHIVFSKEVYKKKFADKFVAKDGSCSLPLTAREKMFSYLKAEEYLTLLKEEGFEKQLLFAKMSGSAAQLLKKQPKLHQKLDEKGVPKFDRFCSGFCLWAG